MGEGWNFRLSPIFSYRSGLVAHASDWRSYAQREDQSSAARASALRWNHVDWPGDILLRDGDIFAMETSVRTAIRVLLLLIGGLILLGIAAGAPESPQAGQAAQREYAI
jgi:hypothetical protein